MPTITLCIWMYPASPGRSKIEHYDRNDKIWVNKSLRGIWSIQHDDLGGGVGGVIMAYSPFAELGLLFIAVVSATECHSPYAFRLPCVSMRSLNSLALSLFLDFLKREAIHQNFPVWLFVVRRFYCSLSSWKRHLLRGVGVLMVWASSVLISP